MWGEENEAVGLVKEGGGWHDAKRAGGYPLVLYKFEFIGRRILIYYANV